ncbi:MAG TPA: arginine deiminase family protein [Longimicrobiales bacterium]
MTNNTRIIAITRAVPASIAECELTFQSRVPIDIERARIQHAEYQRVLTELGCQIVELPEEPNMPDSVFVEDTAVVFDELAIITRPGAESRRAEIPSVRTALARYRALHEIAGNGTLDGGDVLRLGRRVFVGLSTRTNAEGVAQMRSILREFDYDVVSVAVSGTLHLKSVATAIAEDLVVVDPNAIDPASFGTRYVEVAGDAANMLRVDDTVLAPATAARFAARIAEEGLNVELIDNSELAKAEGALTCCSLIFNEWRDSPNGTAK